MLVGLITYEPSMKMDVFLTEEDVVLDSGVNEREREEIKEIGT